MIPLEADLDALFKRLHLANARRVWRDLIQRAERETWPYRDFLTLLVAEEIAHRQQTRLTRLVRRAHFPFLKTVIPTIIISSSASGARRSIWFTPHWHTAFTLIAPCIPIASMWCSRRPRTSGRHCSTRFRPGTAAAVSTSAVQPASPSSCAALVVRRSALTERLMTPLFSFSFSLQVVIL
ncbi:MAG: ATP-binding protein [Vicinamibacterales bacterium]